MCTDMCVDMCVDMCIELCTDVCMDMEWMMSHGGPELFVPGHTVKLRVTFSVLALSLIIV